MTHPYSLSGLYIITDASLQSPEKLSAHVEQALKGGARLVQYRDKSGNRPLQLKQSKQLAQLCNQHNVPLIINDNIELAMEIGAAGVHLGRDDCSLTDARQQLGEQAIIGVSCYNEWQRALTAIENGADYIAFGSFFASKTKPDATPASIKLLQRAKQELQIPVVAIGGITPGNASNLINAGASMVAVVRGVFGEPDIYNAAQLYAELFRHTGPT
ncbi:MAG: thiamine phosphate synthase [Gammaproteobacteria bacterium]